ncbi:MAG: hypothetical protein QNJ36_03170 [Calothrix sp. MO_167.B42]|nr:hypothetical protein [Calothrix sp. MO_167.B42]
MNSKSAIAIFLVLGVGLLAVKYPKMQEVFGDIAKVGVGGYLGQIMPGE